MERRLQRSVSVLVTAVGVTLVCTSDAAAREGLDSGGQLPFELVEDTLIVVRGSIGRLSDLRFVIDTGATRTYIDHRITRTLGLTAAGSRPVHALDGRGQAERILTPSIQFGPTRVESMSGLTTDLAAVSRTQRIDALIGLDLLRLSTFEIDYRMRRIVFEPPDEMPHDVPFATVTPLLGVDVSIQGRPVRLMVDTAASTVMLFPNRMGSRLPRFRLRGQAVVPNAVGTSLAREIELNAVDLGPTRWPNRALLLDVTAEVYHGFDGVLGALPLGLARVQFDFRRSRLAWTRW
jgi:predicted aspartyl protease